MTTGSRPGDWNCQGPPGRRLTFLRLNKIAGSGQLQRRGKSGHGWSGPWSGPGRHRRWWEVADGAGRELELSL